MHTPRVFVKGLAVIIGVLGCLWALAGPLLLIASSFGYGQARLRQLDPATIAIIGTMAALVSFLGYLVAREAWKHLRQPNRATASSVIQLACFMAGFELFQLANRWLAFQTGEGLGRLRIQGLSGLALAVGLLLFYRLVMKRIAERAYPTPEPNA